MMRVNHSCEPNVGMGGNVLLVAMRDIAAGEELTIDYALFLGDPGFAMDCRCRTAACRGVVRGNGLDAHRRAGALPRMVFLVAPAEDHATRDHPGRWLLMIFAGITGTDIRSGPSATSRPWS
jgi:hypothetical protein